MKSKRQEKILEVVTRDEVETQEDLLDRLAAEGFHVTQATISRDIRELKLTKTTTGLGTYRYVQAPQKEESVGLQFNSQIIESIRSVESAMNMVVLKTYPGMAQILAIGIDNLNLEDMLGSIAGDDTIFVVVRSEEYAREFCLQIRDLLHEDNGTVGK
jgi:transcriptional regulator of arginine metabolism